MARSLRAGTLARIPEESTSTYFARFRAQRPRPTSGKPSPAKINVVGSGTPGGGAVGTGTLVVVMFATILPSEVRFVRAVKNESVGSTKSDTAQKFPNPVWPVVIVGPVYSQCRFGIAGLSSGTTPGGAEDPIRPEVRALVVVLAQIDFGS